MHFQLSIITAGLVATIVQAQGLETGYNSVYNDLPFANDPIRESAFDDFGFYYGSPSSFLSPSNPGRVGRSFPDPYSWYFYHNGLPPSPYLRPSPPFFNYNVGSYGGDSGSVWNQRSPPIFDPIAGFPFFNRDPNYYDTVYRNGVYSRNPNAGRAYDSGNIPIINGRDSAFDNTNSHSFLDELFPFLDRPRASDGYAIVDSTITNDKGNTFAVPKRQKLNPGKTNSDDKKDNVVPKAPAKKESKTTLKPVEEEKPAQSEEPTKEKPSDSTSGVKEPTIQEPGKIKSVQKNKPTNEGTVLVKEKPIKEDPIEQPIEKDPVEPKNKESTIINEPED